MAIDRKQPNPMKCSDDIATFNKIKQEQRLYQFLTGIDEKFEVIRRDLLMQEKTPSVESAYAVVRREAARLQILKPTTSSEKNTSLEEVAIGLTARNRPPEQGQGWSRPETFGRRPSQRDKEDKSHLYCTHCGMKKHTKETCFKIVGYPEWWEDFKQKNRKAATVVDIPQTTSNCGDTRREEEAKPQVIYGRVAVTHGGKRREEDTSPEKSDQWIFDCGATDTMTHDPYDFNNLSIPIKTHIETASGELVTVQGEGSIVFFEKN